MDKHNEVSIARLRFSRIKFVNELTKDLMILLLNNENITDNCKKFTKNILKAMMLIYS